MDKSQKIVEQLKILNKEKGPVPKELMDYYKEMTKKQKLVLDSIKDEKTVPEISKETNLSTSEVLWYLTGLVKYGKAEIIPAKTGYMKYKAK